MYENNNWLMFKSGLFFAKLKEDMCLSKQLHGLHAHIDLSYSFASNLTSKLIEEGLLIGDMEGRERKLILTDKGEQVQKLMMEIIMLMNEGGKRV